MKFLREVLDMIKQLEKEEATKADDTTKDP